MAAKLAGVELVAQKWGGRAHYRGVVHHLGVDDHGAWVWGPVGRTIYVGDEAVFVTEQDALTSVPATAWWAIAWWVDHPELDVYVNINTPATWVKDRIVSIDLDLDVVRWRDGRVEIIDRDEFDTNRVRYRYPPDVVAGAEHTAAQAERALWANEPPFDGVAAQRWLAHARRQQFE